MRTYVILLSAALFLTAFACKKKTPLPQPIDNAAEYIVFGDGYGECGGDCTHYYMLKDGKLYADSMDIYSGPALFKVAPLPNTKYLIAQPLIAEFPGYLKNNADTIIGCPDCRDQGIFHFEYKENGLLRRWTVDPDSIPTQMQTFVQHVSKVLDSLKK